jgi:hypothetical protein
MRETLCRDCSAAIYWVELDGGGPHPVNMLEAWPPMAKLVAVNPAKATGRVLTTDDVESGRAMRWRDAGVQFHSSHFATCPAAQRERDHNPNQEVLFDGA